MPKPTPAYTVEQMREALEKSEGLYYLAARYLKCHAKTVEKYVKRHAALKELVHQKKGERIDTVEDVLWDKAKRGEPWAVIFFLKTQGRSRGYTERYEFSHEFKGMSDADLLKFIAERTGAHLGSGDGSAAPGLHDPAASTVH